MRLLEARQFWKIPSIYHKNVFTHAPGGYFTWIKKGTFCNGAKKTLFFSRYSSRYASFSRNWLSGTWCIRQEVLLRCITPQKLNRSFWSFGFTVLWNRGPDHFPEIPHMGPLPRTRDLAFDHSSTSTPTLPSISSNDGEWRCYSGNMPSKN